MKKTLSIILAILMIVATIPFAFAADVVASGNCGANGGNVKWTLDSDGTLTISGTGNMADYQRYPDVPWADYTSDVKKLIIEDGVTSISEHTAYGCFYATSISIGKDVKSIGPIEYTFYCRDLETITVSEDNEYYKSVDNVLFSKDGKELLKVACKAFSGTYNVPDGVVKINEKAFDICKNIEKVVLPDSVEEIGEYAFYKCKSLKILDIGMAKISSVGNGVFEWIEHPVEVIVDKDNEYVSFVNGSLFSKIDGTLFYAYVTDNKCVVPYGVKIIPESTIFVEDGSVVVPDTVETIEHHGINAFDSVVHYLGTESHFQEIYEGDMSEFEWFDIPLHYCVQQSNIPASCTDDGVTEWYCSTCDETIKYVTGYAFGHDIVEVEAKAPTCTEIGWDAYEYCTACDYTTYVEKEALNHKDTLVKVDAKAPTCTEIGWDAYEYCTACTYTTYVEKEALNHKDDDNDSLCDYECGTELVVLDGEMFVVNGDVTNTGIYIGPFDAFNDCYKAGDGYITIIGEGNNDTVMTLYDATIDVRGTETTNAIRISGEDVEIRFFGENNIFADEEAISNAIGSVDHGNIFIGEENAVLNLYGNISACEVTVESGTINIYGSDEKGEIVAVYIEKQFLVSENAVVNIISGDSGIGLNVGILAQKGIIAEGELNAITLNGTETDDEIIYNLIAIGDAVLGADTYSPYYGMEIPEDMNVEVNFIVPEGASVTVPKGITLNLDSMTNVDIDGELIVYGTLICTHTGGENTCDAPAVCDICGTEYGNIDADNHKDTLVQVDAKAPTCTEIGWDAYEYCTACNYTTYVEKEALTHSFTKYEVTEEAKCGVEGKEVAACDNGCGATDEKAIAALTHKDADGDYKCDNGCGHEFEKPAPEEPTPDTPDEPTDDVCDHLCHKGGFMGFIWKIVKFFSKLFKINPVCECGAAHY